MSNESENVTPSPALTLVPSPRVTTQDRLLNLLEDGQADNLSVLREVSTKLSDLNTSMSMMHADMRGVRSDLTGVTEAVRRLEATPNMLKLVIGVGVLVGLVTLAAAGINVRASWGDASFVANPHPAVPAQP